MSVKRRSKRQAKSSNGTVQNASTGKVVYDLVRSPGLLLPPKLKSTFRFQRQLSLTAGATSYAAEEYSMNSPYDPLYTIGGGICTGFATLMSLYSRALVKNATIKLAVCSMSHGGDIYFILPVRSDEAAAGVIPTTDMIMEGQNSTYAFSQGTYTRFSYLSDTRSPAAFQGLLLKDGEESNREELSCAVTTDPTIQPAWYVGLLGAQNHTLLGWILIEYTAELYRPNTLADA